MIKALSIRQPWAYAIVHEGKDIENRTRPLSYRGPLAIHATRRRSFREIFAGLHTISTITGKHEMQLPAPRSDKMLHGGIIAVCDLVDCVIEHKSRWFTGPYGYVLENVRPVPFHACAGKLGLFTIDVALEDLATSEPEALCDPAPVRTIGDLRAAGRRLIMKCRSCKREQPINLALRPISSDTTVESAAFHLTCLKCGSRNVETWAESIVQGRGAQDRDTQSRGTQ